WALTPDAFHRREIDRGQKLPEPILRLALALDPHNEPVSDDGGERTFVLHINRAAAIHDLRPHPGERRDPAGCHRRHRLQQRRVRQDRYRHGIVSFMVSPRYTGATARDGDPE